MSFPCDDVACPDFSLIFCKYILITPHEQVTAQALWMWGVGEFGRVDMVYASKRQSGGMEKVLAWETRALVLLPTDHMTLGKPLPHSGPLFSHL